MNEGLSEGEIIARGRDAKALMEHPLLREAAATHEKTLQVQWVQGKTVEAREASHAEMRALHGLLRTLRTIMDRGTVSEIEAKRAADREAAKNPRKP